MRAGSLHGRPSGGFTLIEVAVVMVIIGILATMLFPVISNYAARADQAKCVVNLRNLHVAASAYLQANNSWPQIPISLRTDDAKAYARQWVAALAPFGAPHAVWICPTAQREMRQPMDSLDKDENYRIDYIPVAFDDSPSSPHRWERFPWFIEKGDLHGRGNLIIFSDGSTAAYRDLVPAGSGSP